jgi:hypothetical protein
VTLAVYAGLAPAVARAANKLAEARSALHAMTAV